MKRETRSRKKVRGKVALPAALKKAIKRRAGEEKKSVSQVVQHALNQELGRATQNRKTASHRRASAPRRRHKG